MNENTNQQSGEREPDNHDSEPTLAPSAATEPAEASAHEHATVSHATAEGANTPPGWYPTPDGGQRYWDGSKWLDIPAPEPRLGASVDVEADGSENSPRPRPPSSRRGLLIGGVAAALVILLLGGGLLAWKLISDSEAARVAAEQVAEAEREREEEQQREKEREEAAQRAEEAAAETERASRAAAIPEIEASVKTMAEEHAAEGLIEGPVLNVTCSPVDGGSIDDLTDLTTVFKCFAATVDNGDGTMTGFTYNATMNWSDGSYTYGLGAP